MLSIIIVIIISSSSSTTTTTTNMSSVMITTTITMQDRPEPAAYGVHPGLRRPRVRGQDGALLRGLHRRAILYHTIL